MHTGVSGCGHFLAKTDEEAIDTARRYLSYMPGHWRETPAAAPPAEPGAETASGRALRVREADCRSAFTSSINPMKVGSRWPTGF